MQKIVLAVPKKNTEMYDVSFFKKKKTFRTEKPSGHFEMVKIEIQSLQDIVDYVANNAGRMGDELTIPKDLVTPANILLLLKCHDKDKTVVFMNEHFFPLRNGWFFMKKGDEPLEFNYFHPATKVIRRAEVRLKCRFELKSGAVTRGEGNPLVQEIPGAVVGGQRNPVVQGIPHVGAVVKRERP